MTTFQEVFDAFFRIITDDMYMEITEEETKDDCWGLLMASLPLFEFPKAPLTFDADGFTRQLTLEEMNILAWGMQEIWIQRQVASCELVRQRMSGQDFRQTSQASHLQRCITLLEAARKQNNYLQKLYSRRSTDSSGNTTSTFGMLITSRRPSVPRRQRPRG